MLVASAVIAWCACTKSSRPSVDIACDDDDDCLAGFVCGAVAGSTDRLCFQRTSDRGGDSGAGNQNEVDAGVSGQPDGGPSAGGGGSGGTTAATDAGAGSGGTSGGDSSQPMIVDATECASMDLSASRTTPTVMLLVDGSASMVDDPDTQMPAWYPPGQMTTKRWDAVRSALVDPTTGVVAQLQGVVKFGLAVYGTGDIFGGGMCPLPLGVVAPALDNLPAVTGGIHDTPPGTFTPTGLALNAIVDMLPDGQSPDPDVVPESPIIVLATDGNPTDGSPDCMSPTTNFQPSIDAAMKAAAKHQKLFVISVGSDSSATHLQQMANIGAGLPIDANPGAKVFYPENTAELATTLSELINAQLSCEVTLEGNGVTPGKECAGRVTIDGAQLECNGPDGWRLKDPHHIEVLGSACEAFKASATTQLVATFPCVLLPP